METRIENSRMAKVMPHVRQTLKRIKKPNRRHVVTSLMQGRSGRILVVDDENAIRDVLSKLLFEMGFQVTVAGSGTEGLNLCLKDSFHLVLTDLHMPGMDGLTLAAHIKDKSPKTMVVLITGSGEEAVMERLKEGCVDSIMFKPFNLRDLQEIVRKMLDNKPVEKGTSMSVRKPATPLESFGSG